ncbi:hypothetical protein [Kaistella pullorum]|uniref:Outer membrane protein beta-barrel domain-containing protein n=1 Tax=Kaistella pullorum TaxID=2763074 RepID=A0ABR8WPN6_9FLAO|nr:hypothetical protein [Kaistella pullorum]MBD8019025.1 hypothetical protein [Kaistella pullorum]
MKKLLFLAAMTLMYSYCNSQIEGTKEITKSEADQMGNIKTKGIKFGISMGFNRAHKTLYEARISPIDTTLVLERSANISFLLSTSVSFPILNGWFGGSYYRKLGADGTPTGNPYFVPRGLNIVATINLVTFNSALGGSGLFNQKLDGGLGIGYTFGENVQMAVTYEMLSFRQPREYLKQFEGKSVIVNGSNITNLPIDDNNFFTDTYIPSLSLKVIYTLN